VMFWYCTYCNIFSLVNSAVTCYLYCSELTNFEFSLQSSYSRTRHQDPPYVSERNQEIKKFRFRFQIPDPRSRFSSAVQCRITTSIATLSTKVHTCLFCYLVSRDSSALYPPLPHAAKINFAEYTYSQIYLICQLLNLRYSTVLPNRNSGTVPPKQPPFVADPASTSFNRFN
jgi:hypothetical protein